MTGHFQGFPDALPPEALMRDLPPDASDVNLFVS
jgi:hypothetical protein